MKKITLLFILMQVFLGGCTLRSTTTSTTTPATETTTYNTPSGTTAVVEPVAVTRTTETTSLQ